MSHQALAGSARLLEEMGMGPLWLRRRGADVTAAVAAMTESPVESAVRGQPPTAQPQASSPLPQPRQLARTDQATQPVRSLAPDDGLPSWLSEMDEAPLASPAFFPTLLHDDEDDAQAPSPAGNPAIAGMDWGALKAAVSDCRHCGLCQGRKQTVFGVGDEQAKWLFIGEGPGRNEDQQGEPFVGPAGKLLDNMLLAMGLKRGDNAYIANIVKCRPTDASGKDRPPSAQEVASCMPYLQRQIALIQPTVLVALGKTAALSLLGLDPATPVSKLRGTVHRYQGLPLVVTYHPAYLLRQLGDKSKTWADLCLAMASYADSAR